MCEPKSNLYLNYSSKLPIVIRKNVYSYVFSLNVWLYCRALDSCLNVGNVLTRCYVHLLQFFRQMMFKKPENWTTVNI